MSRFAFLALLLGLAGCATSSLMTVDHEVQMFASGDIANAEAIAAAAGPGLVVYAACMKSLEPVAMASPNPANDGLLVLGAREMALEQSVYGACGQVLAPILLKALGKAAGPFGIALPF